MMRIASVSSLLLLLMISVVPDAVGQRTGFIIGFGAGPGVTSGGVDPDVGTKMGAAVDFKIGGIVGGATQLYYANKAILFSDSGSLVSSGVSGFGITQQMASGIVVNGLAGLASWADYDWDTELGFGLGAGVGYEFATHWVINLDATWGTMNDTSVFNLAATICVLSH